MRTLLLAVLVALAACDPGPVPPPESGALSGTLSGSTIGPLAGVTVTATPNNGGNGSMLAVSTTTSSNGGYSFNNLPAVSGIIALSGFPTTCQAPAVVNYSVAANATTVVNIQLSRC